MKRTAGFVIATIVLFAGAMLNAESYYVDPGGVDIGAYEHITYGTTIMVR